MNCIAENIRQNNELMKFIEETNLVDWSNDSRKDNVYANEEGMYELLFKRRQEYALEFCRYCFNMIFPQIRKHCHELVLQEKVRKIQMLGQLLRDNAEPRK